MPPPDDRYDDRDSRGRFDDPPPKKKSNALMITLLVIGGVLLVCGGVCGVGGYFYVKAVADVIKAPENFLAQVRAGDYQGAYSSTTATYQGRYTLDQFTSAMKGAKLDQNSGISGAPTSASSGNTITITAGVGVPGGSTSVSFKMVQYGGAMTFAVDDVTGPDIKYPGGSK